MIEISKEELMTLIGGALIGGLSGYVVNVSGQEMSLSEKWQEEFRNILDKYEYLFDSGGDNLFDND